MCVYHRGSAFLRDACLTEGLVSVIMKVSFIFSFSYSYKQILGYSRLPRASCPLIHPLSSTLQMHSRIPQASLRRTCSTSGSQEAQPAPGLVCWEGREMTRLNLGKWLWLQGWPEQLIPTSYPAKSQNRTKLIQVEGKPCLICLFSEQSAAPEAHSRPPGSARFPLEHSALLRAFGKTAAQESNQLCLPRE